VPDGLIGRQMVAERDGDRLVMFFGVPVAKYGRDDQGAWSLLFKTGSGQERGP